MARIPDDELERIKQEVSLERLAEARGMRLSRRGKDLVAPCPFGEHEDEEPSFVITPSRNIFHCFGCDAGGSVIDFVMKAEGVSFRHAVELLRADVPLAAESGSPPAKRSTVRRLPPPVTLDAEDHELLGQVVSFYQGALRDAPPALEYLADRGLDHPEMIDHFRLGFANRTLGYRLPNSQRVAGAEIRGRLRKLGILRKSGHEHLNGRVTIPFYDGEGQVSEIYGRRVGSGKPHHLYLPGPHGGLMNRETLATSKELILCEAPLDALTFWCAGFRNVTTSFGVSGFTEEHWQAFREHGTERVLMAYDRDDRGEKAATKLAERLLAEGIECFRVQFPRGMDANDYALKTRPAAKSLGLALRSARWLGNGRGPVRGIVVPELPPPTEELEPPASVLPEPPPPAEIPEDPEEATKKEDPIAPPSLVASPAAEPAPIATASPAPSPRPSLPLDVRPEEVVARLGDRRYRVRGLARNTSYDLLKVNLGAFGERGFHVETVDLYATRPKAAFIAQAAAEMGVEPEVVKKDLAKLFLELEGLRDEEIRRTLEPQEKPAVTLTPERKKAAEELLRAPGLLDRIAGDLERCGLVGESTNKQVAYLAAVSRLLPSPLAVIVQSSSAAGKSALMEAVLTFLPEEERVQYSAMTGQSLFYMEESNLAHKILAIAEEEGAERASYALKLLQSEGKLSIASTGKDPTTGRLVTQEYSVEGPVAIFSTTTAIDVDEELLNRCVILSVDESREQTRAIHRLQRWRRTPDGYEAWRKRPAIRQLHQDAQRLLRPLAVVNPYAEHLTFLDDPTRTRRDQEKYLTLIETIALLHQCQRPIRRHPKGGYECVAVTLEDIERANELAGEVLGRSLDELPPQTRRLLLLVCEMVDAACERLQMDRTDYRFTRREIREHTGWGNTQLKVHLGRLEEMEYLIVNGGGRGRQITYELLYDGEGRDGGRFLPGLIQVEKLRSAYERKKSGEKGEKSGSSRPQVGPKSGGGRGSSIAGKASDSGAFEESDPDSTEKALPGSRQKDLFVDVGTSRRPISPSLVARAGGGN